MSKPKFDKWVEQLVKRVMQLNEDSSKYNTAQLETELNKCRAYLLNLYEHAERYEISISDYYEQFSDIDFVLMSLTEKINSRVNNPVFILNKNVKEFVTILYSRAKDKLR